MTRRLLALCLLAYPRATRRRDGAYLLDLAGELGEGTGDLRQALSLLRGGLAARLRRVRRPVALLVGGVAVGLLALGGVAAADRGSVRIEVRSCSGTDCAAARAWAEGLARDGWACARSAAPGEVSWQCVES